MKYITMPIQEVIDRYTICLLKVERLPNDDVQAMKDQARYYLEGIDMDTMSNYVTKMYKANADIWDTEHDIRKGVMDDADKAVIGELALKVRDLNCARTLVKNEIAEEFGGFKDVKMNYGS